MLTKICLFDIIISKGGDGMEYKVQKLASAIDVTGISYINYFEFTNQYSTHKSLHDFCELLFVDKGEIFVNADNYCGTLSVNELIIHRPNEEHTLSVPDGGAPNVIVVGFECDCEALVPLSKAPVRVTSAQSNMLAQILQEAMNCFEPPFDVPYTSFMTKRKDSIFAAEQMVKNSLESFLINLVRECTQSKNLSENTVHLSEGNIQAVHQYLSENYTSKIYLDKLCFLFNTNKSTLCKQFKSEYGKTVLGYVNSLRIKEAKSLMRANKKSVTQIAEEVGFESIHYFSRIFKKHTGQTPSEYAKSVKAKLNI